MKGQYQITGCALMDRVAHQLKEIRDELLQKLSCNVGFNQCGSRLLQAHVVAACHEADLAGAPADRD